MKITIDVTLRFAYDLIIKEAFLKYIAMVLSAVFLLSACAPKLQVQNNVLPTLISVTSPTSPDGMILLQGRYFGDGQSGQAEDSYVLVGADVFGTGGVAVRASSWSTNRIEVAVPKAAGSGFVFVFVRGNRSNGLPTTLP